MYAVKIRQHLSATRSLKSAESLREASYVVDAEFQTALLDANNVVMDAGLAARVLGEVLQTLGSRVLDELPQFRGKPATPEFLANQIHEEVSRRVRSFFQGRLAVTLGEPDKAVWATYEGTV